MTRMVCGFLFDRQRDHVLLVRKTHPAWQRGYANGIGGKVEDGEKAEAAMRREFDEEANHGLTSGRLLPDWTYFATVVVPAKETHVFFFRAFAEYSQLARRDGQRTDTDEVLIMAGVGDVRHRLPIPNLNWLVPLALDNEVMNAPQIEMAAT